MNIQPVTDSLRLLSVIPMACAPRPRGEDNDDAESDRQERENQEAYREEVERRESGEPNTDWGDDVDLGR